MKSIQKLREQRNEAAKQVRNLVENHPEDQAWTAENDAEYNKLVAVVENKDAEIGRLQKAIDIAGSEESQIESFADRNNISIDEATQRREWTNQLFNAWARGGVENLTEEQQKYFDEQNRKFSNTLSTGTNSEGGYTTHSEFGGELLKAMKAFGGVREVATIQSTENGNPIEWPTMNATSEEGELVGENADVSGLTPSFGTVNIGAFKYSSKEVAVPFELLQDNLVNLESHIMLLLRERLARITNKHYTVGDGSSKPTGIVEASALGLTAAAQAAITFDELIDLEHSVDPAYRAANMVRWMFHDQTLKALKKLKDGDSRPIWLPGYTTSEASTIMGYEYTINQNMATLGAGNKAVLFGDMSKYMIRDVMAVQLFRMTDSNFTRKGQVGFLAFLRTDGQFIGADTGCISHLICAP